MAPRRSFGLILLSGLLSLAAGELMVRLAAPQAIGLAPPMYLPDSTLAHRLKPRFSGRLRSGEYSTRVVINDRGFRGAAWREDALLRVLVLGDSFTFGYGVEEREAYPAVVEELLAAAGCRVAVCNAGVPGYGTLQEAALAERLLTDLAPQAVVLGFTVGSDVQDNLQQGIR
ncbi:MAG: GDSL-type esterase/lipase family protein, partial [Candidatus Eisenbacteria bacterium]|nr:GDSL-type esterase/lipase family protein [Candidatus Eisenbacteria bacterium]